MFHNVDYAIVIFLYILTNYFMLNTIKCKTAYRRLCGRSTHALRVDKTISWDDGNWC